MQQTFSVEREARINLTRIHGDLEVKGWDNREISLEWEGQSGDLQQEGNVFMLVDCAGDVKISAPYDVEIRVEGLGGEASAQDIRRIELKDVHGDVELENIGADANLENIGEAIYLMDIGGDLHVQKAPSLRARRKIGGDAELQEVPRIQIDAVGADLKVQQATVVAVGSIGGDLEAVGVTEALRCGNVGGDCQIEESASAEINLGNIGGDLHISGAVQVHLGNTSGDTEIHDVRGDTHIGNIGGDGTITGVGGNLTVGQVGSDARLLGLGGSMRVGGIGGDLELQAVFAAESRSHAHVGGDAKIILPDDANLSLQATVGGSIRGSSIVFDRRGNLVRLVYGEGMARVTLSVGGDLELRGGGQPQVSSASMPWEEFSREMADLGQGMAQLGQELGDEFMEIFSDMGWAGLSWTDNVSRKVEDQMRRARQKAEQHARKAAERARQAEERARHAQDRAWRRAERAYVRVNEREWQMNPDRLNDLVNRAQQAAMEGVAGAMEAVERAVGNLRMQHPGRSNWPPTPPMPPMPPAGGPVPPVPPVPPMPPTGWSVPPVPPLPHEDVPQPPTPPAFTSPAAQPEAGATDQAAHEAEEAGAEPSLEQEREAILRMIAEGRITPEEGDMLLEGLGG